LKLKWEIVIIDEGKQIDGTENASGEKKTLGLRIENRTMDPSRQVELIGKYRWVVCK
jgi:hypothetical protein